MPLKDLEKLKKYKHEWYIKNFDRISKKAKITRRNPEVKAKLKQYQRSPEYKEKQKIFRNSKHYKDWKEDNKEKIALDKHKHYLRNRQKIIDRAKQWEKDNIVKVRKARREKHRFRRSTEKEFKIKSNLRSRLRSALKYFTKTGKILSSRDYFIDYQKIIEHLRPFPEDISLYHIDHIKPLCSFNLENEEEVKMAFAPENHQWLLAFDNLSKGGKYEIQ